MCVCVAIVDALSLGTPCVCLSVCLSVTQLLPEGRADRDEIWHVGGDTRCERHRHTFVSRILLRKKLRALKVYSIEYYRVLWGTGKASWLYLKVHLMQQSDTWWA